MATKAEKEWCEDRREALKTLMQEIMDVAGGAAKVAQDAWNKFQRQPMSIAIEIMGGAIGTAEVLKISRQAVDKWLLKDVGDWPGKYLELIEEATKIPVLTLLLDKGPVKLAKDKVPK